MTKQIKPLPWTEYLRSILKYDVETGDLFWKHRIDVSPEWNIKWAGKPAGCKTENGRYVVGVCRAQYQFHRIVWKIYYGSDPSGQIDHIDGDPLNNRIANLRVVSQSGNNKNKARSKHNTSGVTGVYWSKPRGMWYSQIRENYKLIHIGFFTEKADAIAARKQAERDHGFHPNHGRAQE